MNMQLELPMKEEVQELKWFIEAPAARAPVYETLRASLALL